MSFPIKDQVLKDIQLLYERALSNNKLTAALRAKELQGKAIGLFKPQRLPNILRIADMTEEQLRDFIDRLEKNDPELKNLELPEGETQ
jgi:hypothetical protein